MCNFIINSLESKMFNLQVIYTIMEIRMNNEKYNIVIILITKN